MTTVREFADSSFEERPLLLSVTPTGEWEGW